MDYRYIYTTVSFNAYDGMKYDNSLNKLIAEILLQEDKGIVKDAILLDLVKGVVK